ncbi:allograft inflammatory factor 1-like [Hyla sarda]|uniref:allograft inflammatory factor 1-like n=1 Tax=Hyla sarda TaxID=327740 RepID=UPI0024C2D61C|nr:allograft inflammatory factor 1-like [Hyla sarda]
MSALKTFQVDVPLCEQEYLRDEPFQDITHLAGKLEKLKRVFMKYDRSSDGEIDYVTLHAMAQDLGIITTVAELEKRVQDITGNTKNALSYKDCAMAILGRRSTMCQRIRSFSGQDGEFEKRPCWLDRVFLSYVSHLEFTLSPNLLSPIAFLPPPPPPSPADSGAMENTQTYPAA